jgi:hypothetical protein
MNEKRIIHESCHYDQNSEVGIHFFSYSTSYQKTAILLYTQMHCIYMHHQTVVRLTNILLLSIIYLISLTPFKFHCTKLNGVV